MKVILILSFFISFQSTSFAQTETAMGMGYPSGFGGFGSGMGFPGMESSGSAPKTFDVTGSPEISIQIGDNKKSISCSLDSATKIYVCPNSGDTILVKASSYGFSALGRDEKKAATLLNLSHIEAAGKIVYDIPPMPPGYGMGGGYGSYGDGSVKPNLTKDLNLDFRTRVSNIDEFFGTGSPLRDERRKKGSADYEKIVQSFMDEKQNLQDVIKKVFNEKNYSVELDDGQKVNCERSSMRELTEQQKYYRDHMGVNFKCGTFKCDPVEVDGKEYQVTMLYDSTPGSFATGSIHLMDNDGIGPEKSIKKIFSSQSPTPLLDNSYSLENAGKSYNRNYISSMLPASLKQDRDKISKYKDPSFEQLIAYNKSICDDSDKALDNLLEGKKKLVSKLANLEMAQFIQVLSGGSLVGQYVDPTLAPQLGCLYQGVYLNEEAAKNLDRLKKNIHPDDHVDQTISLERATDLFNQAAGMKDIAWKYKPDGCYARAHLMARRFEAQGVRVDKVWIKGDLYVPGTGIEWNFHVAPIVYVKDEKGNIQKIVIDPSLFEKPVTVEEWDHKMAKKTAKGSVVAAFPFPENSAFMERSTLSFSSSDPYLPRDNINMTEADKMEQANDTMSMYKAVEPK